jgi:hypothetical protein
MINDVRLKLNCFSRLSLPRRGADFSEEEKVAKRKKWQE